jgi:hypothetical protein
MLSIQPGICGRKMATFQLFFSAQETGVSTTEPDMENTVGKKDTGNQVVQFLLGCKCPVRQGIAV